MKQTITVELDVPEGFEATGEHRVPNSGELFMSIYGGDVCHAASSASITDGRRFILRKLPPAPEETKMTRKRWIRAEKAEFAQLIEENLSLDDNGDLVSPLAHFTWPDDTADIIGSILDERAHLRRQFKARRLTVGRDGAETSYVYDCELTGEAWPCDEARLDADCNKTHKGT